MGDKAMTKERLQELLEAKLPVDATRSQLHAALRDQQELTAYLAEKIGQLTTMVLAHKGAIEHTANAIFGDEPDEPALVGFGEPAIILPRAN